MMMIIHRFPVPLQKEIVESSFVNFGTAVVSCVIIMSDIKIVCVAIFCKIWKNRTKTTERKKAQEMSCNLKENIEN